MPIERFPLYPINDLEKGEIKKEKESTCSTWNQKKCQIITFSLIGAGILGSIGVIIGGSKTDNKLMVTIGIASAVALAAISLGVYALTKQCKK